jgi:hypothetical protein
MSKAANIQSRLNMYVESNLDLNKNINATSINH